MARVAGKTKIRPHLIAFVIATIFLAAGGIWLSMSSRGLSAALNASPAGAWMRLAIMLVPAVAVYFALLRYLQSMLKDAGAALHYLDLAEVMLLVRNRRGEVVFINRKGCRLMGCREEDVLGRNWFDSFLPSDEREEMKALFARQMRGDIPPIEYFEQRVVTQAGDVKLLAMHNSVLSDKSGEVVGLLSSGQDMTDIRGLEEANRRLAAIVESSEDAIFSMTWDGVMTSWNRGAERLYGYSRDEVLGQPVSLLAGKDRAREAPPLLKTIQEGGMVEHFETVHRRKDGMLVDVSLSFSPVKTGGGRLKEVSAIARDITRSKRLEKEILQVAEREQQRIGQDLHDGLGQNLTAVTFLAQLLQKKLGTRAMPEARDAAEISKLVSESIEQVRNLSRGLYPVELNANGLVPALQEMADIAESKYGIPCQVEPGALLPDMDPAANFELYRIAQEAVNNAMKHARPGRVTVRVGQAGDRLVLSVEDDGIGLPASVKNAKGMGMHIMKRRAAMIGAALEVTGGEGGGTIVSCSAPARVAAGSS